MEGCGGDISVRARLWGHIRVYGRRCVGVMSLYEGL